jgi:hypothetical protein
MKLTVTAVFIAFCAASTLAQVASPSVSQPAPIPAMPSALTPPSFAPVLAQINTTVQSAMLDLGKLRINKWKADSQQKQQAQSYAASVEHNIREALPGMTAQVRSDPQNVAASFRLYRNLNALYDVFSALTESAGAFGPKDEFQALATDANNLDAARRQLGDDVERLAAFNETQLRSLRSERQQQTQATAAPTKTIVIDDETPKKTKKAPTKKKKQPATPAQPTTTQPSTTTKTQ